jgi:diadenosine tetraphosphate (Ap4A) HIT family hydrolase
VSSLERLWAGWRGEYIESVSGRPASKAAGDCVFCGILASGETDDSTHILWRHPAGTAFAILNAYPYASGHLMVMPTRHVGDIEELAPDESAAVWGGLSSAVVALKSAYRPDGINIGANLGKSAGAGVPGHFHVHAVPRWNGDTNFMTSVADTRVLPEALSVSAARLRSAWPSSD